MSSPQIILERSPPWNSDSFLPVRELEVGRDCKVVVDSDASPRPKLMQTDFILYNDGSCSRPSDGQIYAVVTDSDVLESGSLPHGTSAQAAELYSRIRACTLTKDKSVTIYTDSHYAFGAARDFSVVHRCVRTQPPGPVAVASFNEVAALQNHSESEEKRLWIRKGCA